MFTLFSSAYAMEKVLLLRSLCRNDICHAGFAACDGPLSYPGQRSLLLPVSSRETAVLKRIPFFAPIPLPTIMATGVARPNAHGQLMTRTEIPRARANAIVSPARSQPMVVITAIVMTAARTRRIPYRRSSRSELLWPAASLTILMIWERVVSSPTLDASQRIKPDWFKVAAETRSPAALSTGILSPVRADSFMALFPSKHDTIHGNFHPDGQQRYRLFNLCRSGPWSQRRPFDHRSLRCQLHQAL